MPDQRDQIRTFAEAHGLRELARLADVPPMTIHGWIKRGTPRPVEQWLKVLAVVQAKGGRPRKGKA